LPRGGSRIALSAKKGGFEPGNTPPERIRNFSIIAHIDHGKSTLADRFLEMTNTISAKDMQSQIMDTMDIERERGITIKLNTARLNVKDENGDDYGLNLIDTPGHVDFTYEVSRSLAACEGALLVVDASQGVEAQTLANVTLAMENDLTIVPVLNKIDLPAADPDRVAEEIEDTIGIECTEAVYCSAKTGLGVDKIIQELIAKVPPPKTESLDKPLRCLIYDSFYDNYVGVIVMFKIIEGQVKKGDKIRFMNSGKEYFADEIGITVGGKRTAVNNLRTGEVGYMFAQIKQVSDARVGDTICHAGMQDSIEALPGYAEAVPTVFCGLFPEVSAQFEALRTAFERLALNDAALSFEPENSTALGLGFRVGFLGLLHMEVIIERLRREYDLDLVVTAPSVSYEVDLSDGNTILIEYANALPERNNIKEIREPYVLMEMIMPEEFLGRVQELCANRRAVYRDTQFLTQGRALMTYEMPMAELIRDFFGQLKSVSRGYASMDYRHLEYRPDDLVKLEVDINKVTAHTLATIVHRTRAVELARKMVEILKDEIPQQLIMVQIQARLGSQIVASAKINAVRKNVLAKCYGGDITRKMKLIRKQAEGKKKMQALGKVSVPSGAIMAVIKGT
jgi:GTP-binding protein LepA